MKYAAFVLDMSGSMAGLQHEAITGLNEWLQTVKQQSPMSPISVKLFNHVPFDYAKVQEARTVAEVTPKSYFPSGSTALYDAIGETIADLESVMTDQDEALVLIFTDGYENASTQFDAKAIQDKLTALKATGRWEVKYLSSEPNAVQQNAVFRSAGYSIDTSFAATQGGIATAYAAASASTMNWYNGSQTTDTKAEHKASRGVKKVRGSK